MLTGVNFEEERSSCASKAAYPCTRRDDGVYKQ